MERGYGEMVFPVWGVEENFPDNNVEGKKLSSRVVDKKRIFIVKPSKEREKDGNNNTNTI